MFIEPQRLRRSEKDNAREHPPLDFQPCVGAIIEQIPDDRVTSADQAGEQYQPFGDVAKQITYPVDYAAD